MAPLYFIECAGKIMGRKAEWFPERDTADMNLTSTARDILEGQVSDVRRVWCAEDGRFTDETEAVARKMADMIVDGADMPARDVYEFMECALSCRFMADLVRELEVA
jgi:hypothetical protein